MQHWSVILDYPSGPSETVDDIRANSALLAAGVARLCRRARREPAQARVYPASGAPIGRSAA